MKSAASASCAAPPHPPEVDVLVAQGDVGGQGAVEEVVVLEWARPSLIAWVARASVAARMPAGSPWYRTRRWKPGSP